jgi:long-chain acyl-CoA synthetase
MDSAAPWLAHYDKGVPATLAPYPSRTILDYIADAARAYPSQPALLFKGSKTTYAELDALSDACASAFYSLGIRRGDRVALLMPNCPQFIIAELGAWKIGAIVAPLNPTYTDRELELPLRENAIENIVTLTRFYGRVKGVQPRTPLKRVIATNIKEFFPPLLRLLFTALREKRDGDRVSLAPGDHDFAHLLLVNRGRKPPDPTIGGDDPAILLMSGGTTGTAKGVLGKHAAYVLTGLQIGAWFASVLEPRKDIVLTVLPLFHVYANLGLQPMAFVAASTLALVPNPRDLSDVIATIKRVRPTFFPAVPTLFIALLNHDAVKSGKVSFKSIKACFSGASALMADTKERFERLTGGRIIEGYSLTEAMMALCANPVKGPNKIGSVGMPFPDVHVRIFDDDEGTRVMPPKQMGEICFSAAQIMTGFWNRPEETAGVLRDHVEAGGTRRWLHTGDLGYIDEAGYVFIVDRKKDLIKTSGQQVWPREVEEVLSAHPAVKEVGVAGVPDPVRMEAVKAWVVLRGGETASEQELRTYCREHLAPFKVPSSIEFRTELPKTMVGKVLRRALRGESPK